jgi:hypothetical protein
MPQVGYDTRRQAIILREAALFDFDHCPNFSFRVSELGQHPKSGTGLF